MRDVDFEAQQALAAGRAQQVVHQPEQVGVHRLVERRALDGLQMPLKRSTRTFLGDMTMRAPSEAPPIVTISDGWISDADVPAGHGEAAQHGADHDDASDDDNHEAVLDGSARASGRDGVINYVSGAANVSRRQGSHAGQVAQAARTHAATPGRSSAVATGASPARDR